jgi:hypothetical protein
MAANAALAVGCNLAVWQAEQSQPMRQIDLTHPTFGKEFTQVERPLFIYL